MRASGEPFECSVFTGGFLGACRCRVPALKMVKSISSCLICDSDLGIGEEATKARK